MSQLCDMGQYQLTPSCLSAAVSADGAVPQLVLLPDPQYPHTRHCVNTLCTLHTVSQLYARCPQVLHVCCCCCFI
jgi:hypothetical protein